jgi:uracil-DNA glycosylase
MLPDDERIVRRVISRAAGSPVFLVGQALGPDTQRRSGLPYTYPNGSLSATGRALDRLLHMLGFTIDPSSALPYVYSSDILQRYPGRSAAGGGDRRPTRGEVANCAEWLDAELRVVRPRVILLLGKESATYFLRAHGRAAWPQWGAAHSLDINGSRAVAFVVYHPAYRRRQPELVDALYASVARRARRLLRPR